MSRKTISMTDALHAYMIENSVREPEILRRLREETGSHPEAQMQIAPEQGQLMAFLIKLTGARKALEVGVFTGYSSLAVALALPPDGTLTACDISDEYTRTARRYWAEAGVSDRIDLRIAPAIGTLDRLRADGASNTYDFAFIDADKESYDSYYESCLDLVRPGGLIMLDNVFRGGKVAETGSGDAGTSALQALNRKIAKDARVDIVMVPIADGVTLTRRRP